MTLYWQHQVANGRCKGGCRGRSAGDTFEMKIYGGELTPDQIDAGLRVMKGRFNGSSVMKALASAGVVNIVSGAEALIAREIRNGHISRITRGIYQENCNSDPKLSN
jgi:hypothetical protein